MLIPLFPYYFAHKTWQDSSLFKYIGPAALTVWMVAASFYNLRMFYRVPHRYLPAPQPFLLILMYLTWCSHRLYYSSTSDSYKVVLNQMLPWQKKLVVPFRPSEISQVDLDKSGWKVAFQKRTPMKPNPPLN